MFDNLRQDLPATSAIFSVVKAVLITPLPYSQPEQTVQIFTRWTAFEKTWIADQEVVDFQNMSKTMTSLTRRWRGPTGTILRTPSAVRFASAAA